MELNILKRLERGEIVFVGKKIYRVCKRCGKIIQINKPIIGSVHICD